MGSSAPRTMRPPAAGRPLLLKRAVARRGGAVAAAVDLAAASTAVLPEAAAEVALVTVPPRGAGTVGRSRSYTDGPPAHFALRFRSAARSSPVTPLFSPPPLTSSSPALRRNTASSASASAAAVVPAACFSANTTVRRLATVFLPGLLPFVRPPAAFPPAPPTAVQQTKRKESEGTRNRQGERPSLRAASSIRTMMWSKVDMA